MSEQTPNALRKHVVLLGNTNAGKSTLFNALLGQDSAIVSQQPGTTTDPVRAAMELHPFGPVVLIDTAGTGDTSPLGQQRMKKTAAVCRRADAAVYVAAANDFDRQAYRAFCQQKLPHLLVITKTDAVKHKSLTDISANFPSAILMKDAEAVSEIKTKLVALLAQQQPEDATLIGDLLPAGSHVIMVVPLDDAAPKGRLILPQVQLLRDCLDHHINCMVVRETQLESALRSWDRVDLVVTDSQIFSYVSQRVNRRIPLTSFSMLLARQKGDFAQLVAGVQAVDGLPEGARILMLEGCTHNVTHQDIGRIKLPNMLQKVTDKQFRFTHISGYDFPENLEEYDLAVQCGSCMINRREVAVRLERMAQTGLPVTNYGILLAKLSGILDRCCEIFSREGTV